MAGNRTRLPIIGRFETDQAQSPFLQLVDKSGQAVLGGIDSAGFRFGSLAAGDFVGVTQLTGNYLVQTSDNGFLLSVSNSAPVTITLPDSAPITPFYVQVQNAGSGTVTIAPNGLQMDGSASSITLNTNQGLLIASSGTAYFTQRGIGGGSNAFAGVNAQTADYVALPGDTGKLITFTKSSAVQLTLPASAPSSSWFVYVQNRGTGDLTVNRNGNQIDGATTNLVLHQYQGVIIYCDGTNYFTQRGVTGLGNVNVQTNDYTALPGDTGKLIAMNKASAVQLTLPATSPGPTWVIFIQNIGAGALTVNRNGLTIDGGSLNLTLTQNQGLIIYSDGTNYFTERGSGSTASNVAIKPAQATGIQFVAVATGNDSNDGYSWGTAKLTIMAAYDALPAYGGTIFIAGPGTDGTQWPSATSTPGQGIWIMGTNDPNYSSPPAGWRTAKNGQNVEVAFIGVPSTNAGANQMTGNQTAFLGGNSSNPAIWLSGITGVSFRNLYSQYPKSFAWIGTNSNGNKNDGAGGSDIIFDNCGGNVNGGSSGFGPVFDIGPNLFWLRFTNCSCSCNPLAAANSKERSAFWIDEGKAPNATITQVSLTSNVATYTANNNFYVGNGLTVVVTGTSTAGGIFNVTGATVLSATPTQFTVAITHADVGATSDSGTAQPGFNIATGIVNFENCDFTGGGGIRYQNIHEGTAGHFVSNCESEGTGNSQPLYEVLSGIGTFSATLFFSAGISDSGDNPPKVRIPSSVSNYAVKVYGQGGFNNIDFVGPMTFLGSASLTSIVSGGSSVGGIPIGITNPQAQNQKGSIYSKALDQGDWARRMHGLTLARYTNLANQDPTAWTTHGSPTVVTGLTAPDGTLNAASVSGTDSTSDLAQAFSGNLTIIPGDYLYFGVWMRVTPPPLDGVQSPTPGIWFPFGGPSFGSRVLCGSYNVNGAFGFLFTPSVVQTDGEWQWVWGVIKATLDPGIATGTWAALPCSTPGSSGHKAVYYNPIMCQIPSTSVQLVANSTIASAGTPGAQQTGNIVTITTTGSHGLVPGMIVCVKGVSASGYNGEFAVKSILSSTQFTYYNTTTGLGNSGSGTVVPGNDSEVAEWAMNAASYSNLITAGPTAVTPRGVNLAFGGSGDSHFAILDHTALSANRTFTAPNASGTWSLLEAAQAFSAQQSFTGNIQVGVSGTAIAQIAVFTATLTPSSVLANTSAEEEYTVTGISLSPLDKVFLGSYPAPTAGTVVGGVRVSNTNKIKINWGNLTGSPATPASGSYVFVAVRSS